VKKSYYVNILGNNLGTFYIGMTGNLVKRVCEFKNKLVDGFTKNTK